MAFTTKELAVLSQMAYAEIKWKEDIEKVFERHKELFKKMIIAEQNKQQ